MADGDHRFYRYQHRGSRGWVSFQVRYRETDLWIRAGANLEKEATAAVLSLRRQLEQYIASHPEFMRSLQPLPEDRLAPCIVRQMLRAARITGVGPMAGVAGAIAQSVALELKPLTPSLIIENGGDCYLDVQEDTTVGIYAGANSPFDGRLALHFLAERFPLSICTSSGTVGHSLSFGRADAVTVVARNAALADAAATALGNLVREPRDIAQALEQSQQIPDLEGVLILVRDKMGVRGNLELIPLQTT